MLHARLDLITADPLALGGCITYIEREVRPAAESRPGSLGLSLLASPESGAAVLESFWASRDALAASEQAEALQCGELARRARGSVTSEQYQLPVFEREAGGNRWFPRRVAVRQSGFGSPHQRERVAGRAGAGSKPERRRIDPIRSAGGS